MASPQRYVIEFHLVHSSQNEKQGGAVDSAATASGENSAGKMNRKKAKNPETSNNNKAIAVAAYGYAKKAAGTIVASYVDTVELRTGQSQYQKKLQVASSLTSQIWGFGESIALGAATGGPVGAVIAGSLSVASYAINRTKEEMRLSMEESLESVSLSQARIRAGAGGSR